jgi:medium-chain acyl-[acyl-carrier-protein] hydrolase
MTPVSVFDRWWVIPRPNSAASLRLVCFPHAGGNASVFRAWHTSLPSEIEVCAVQLPGRANRMAEPAINRLADLVEAIGVAMTPLLDKPVALFGHSMGALMGFEVARWLRRHRGLLPAHLMVCGRRAPQLPATESPHYLQDDEAFLANLSRLKGTPVDLLHDLLPLILPTMRADFEAVETYKYTDEPPLACPITVFGGRDDEESLEGRLTAWQSQTTGTFSEYLMDGGHFFMHADEQGMLSRMGGELQETIAELRRGAGAARSSLSSPQRT